MSWRQGGLHSLYFFCLLKGVYIPSVPFFYLLVYIRKKQIYIFSLCLAGSFHQFLMIKKMDEKIVSLYNKDQFVNFMCFLYWLM